MKKIIGFIFIIVITFSGCKAELNCCENIKNVNVTLNFTHNWDGVPVTSSDFKIFKFINKNGELISIERLRYVVSNINIGDLNNNYQLINVGDNTGLEIEFNQVPSGNQQLKFTFGFSDTDNTDGIYKDLNSVNFNVPEMLGGGYHYMQFDGKYLDTNNQESGFNYHAIRAVDRTDPNILKFEDTSFEVDLGAIDLKENTTIEINVNLAEWFKNPNTWDLNQLNTVLMPNFEAQKLMSANGKSVFSLGKVGS